MGFFKRLFSADYRAAVAAEAAGDLELAAERYALAGQREAAVRVHLARAERADSRASEIDALRDALHWAPAEGDWRQRVARALGQALLARVRAEGVATDRDRERVREAARILIDGGEHGAAGEALESIGDDDAAAEAFRAGGLVDSMEEALARGEDRARREQELHQAFADYEVALRGGERDSAVAHLRRCVELAEKKGEYRRLLDELESRLITGGRAVLGVRGGETITILSGEQILLGRDPLCDLPLRAGGISRRHAEIGIQRGAGEARYELRDGGSRNGTLVGGMRITGSIPLAGEGTFSLGPDCDLDFRVAEDGKLSLRVARGIDQGTTLLAAAEGEPIPLEDHGVPLTLYFRRGRPLVRHPGTPLVLSGERLVHGDFQLIHGDQVSIGGIEVEVE